MTPDWVCEILPPTTIRVDRVKKMRIYPASGVPHVGIVDPAARTLDAFRLESGKWLLLDTHGEEERVRAEPFQQIEIELGRFGVADK